MRSSLSIPFLPISSKESRTCRSRSPEHEVVSNVHRLFRTKVFRSLSPSPFALFQADAFARVLARSTAVSSFIVVMNGRLAFPVRDQLIAMKGENNTPYLQASRLVGVEVTRKLFRRLYGAEHEGGLALDRRRVGIMNASLRIYGDQIPDITQIWGSPAITIFPNARHALDSTDRVFDPDAVPGVNKTLPCSHCSERARSSARLTTCTVILKGNRRGY